MTRPSRSEPSFNNLPADDPAQRVVAAFKEINEQHGSLSWQSILALAAAANAANDLGLEPAAPGQSPPHRPAVRKRGRTRNRRQVSPAAGSRRAGSSPSHHRYFQGD